MHTILVDTFVWFDHLHKGEAFLQDHIPLWTRDRK
jgi:hypothetical protein